MARPVVMTLGWCAAACTLVLVCLACLAAANVSRAAPAGRIDFDRDVRPILSENCFSCHGPDAARRMAGLRLDDRAGATAALPSGRHAIVPGRPDQSSLVVRIAAAPAFRMPPASSGKTLTPAQVGILVRWIQEGARYAPHWSFVPPVRPALPAVRRAEWVRNPIDRFVLARLEAEGLHPAPEADRVTLIRRVSLDLTGLPPTPAEVDAYVADNRPGAYERLVDRLLASPRYGERMAMAWLDLARYADTHGYHIDSHRDMWPWRDWVIRAYNANRPYDQFVVEQLAGDMLPGATLDQRIATGFNRNHPINFEGGAIPEEYAAAYVMDRVDTTSTAFMGLTMKCAQCHDHKYDPLSQKEYYRFLALFNNVPEEGLDGQKGNAKPFLRVPTVEQRDRLEGFGRRAADLEAARKAREVAAEPDVAAWVSTAGVRAAEPAVPEGLAAHLRLDHREGARAADAAGKLPDAAVAGKVEWAEAPFGRALALDGTTFIDLGAGAGGFERTDAFSYGAWVYLAGPEAGTVLSRMDDADSFRGWDLYIADGRAFAHLIHKWEQNALRVNTKVALPYKAWRHVFVTYDGTGKAAGVRVYVDGKPAEVDITHDTLSGTIRTAKPLTVGRRSPGAPFRGRLAEVRLYGRALSAEEVARIAEHDTVRPLLAVDPDKRTGEQRQALSRFYLEHHDAGYRKLTADLAAVRKEQGDLENAIPTVMVMEEMPKPRDTFLLERGQYDKRGEKVAPGVPGALPSLPAGAPVNRLTLARWLVRPNHPLTGRVAVNRLWEMLFGTGLVKTSENFGAQGERPSNPALLDWLATEFARTGWDTKGMLRLLVTSATYRQSSRATRALLERDPENRLLARGPRIRLPAETVRDQALLVSGLLVEKVGGPSVKPYQPAGLWEEISFKGGFTAQYYEQDHGEALYRRSMYTFWKRTCPPPMLQTLDAPEREFCVVRRSVTNTPLQALAMLNDPTYVEAARKFAERIMREGGPAERDRVRFAVRSAIGRTPREAERDALLALYRNQRARYALDRDAALKLLSVGESKRDETLGPAELAAWTMVANVVLNLDEAVTKQ